MQNNGKTICFKIFLVELLRKWRRLFVFLLIGVVLGGIFGCYQFFHVREKLLMTEEEIVSINSTVSQNNATIESYEEELITQKANLEMYIENKNNYENLLEEAKNTDNLDGELIFQISEMTQYLAELNSQINVTQQRIDTLTGEISNLKDSNINLTNQTKQTVKINKSIIVYYSVLGMVILLILFVGYHFLIIVFDDKVRTSFEISKCYGIPMLGSIYQKYTTEELKEHKGIDAIIDSMEKQNVDENEICKIVAAKMGLYANGHKQILITGEMEDEELLRVRDKLLKHIDGEMMEIIIGANPLANPNTILEMKNSVVLLVVKVGESRIKEIEKIITIIRESHTKIIGIFNV